MGLSVVSTVRRLIQSNAVRRLIFTRIANIYVTWHSLSSPVQSNHTTYNHNRRLVQQILLNIPRCLPDPHPHHTSYILISVKFSDTYRLTIVFRSIKITICSCPHVDYIAYFNHWGNQVREKRINSIKYSPFPVISLTANYIDYKQVAVRPVVRIRYLTVMLKAIFNVHPFVTAAPLSCYLWYDIPFQNNYLCKEFPQYFLSLYLHLHGSFSKSFSELGVKGFQKR